MAGPSGLYLYPPPFTLLAVPFALLPAPLDVGGWLVAILAAFAAGVAILPVRRDVRWLIVLLAGLSWPFAYAVKLGQVGPILFLCFAIGWRWLDRPVRLGAAIAIGTIIKLQPAILLVWAALTRRWQAIGVCLAVLVGAAARRDAGGRTGCLVGLADDPALDQRADHDAPQLHPGRDRLPGRAR